MIENDNISSCLLKHDDVTKWKHFPRNWPFVRGIHRSRWIPHTKAGDRSFDVFFDLRLNKRLSKQWWGWWFETLSRPWWRHRNGGMVENDNISSCLLKEISATRDNYSVGNLECTSFKPGCTSGLNVSNKSNLWSRLSNLVTHGMSSDRVTATLLGAVGLPGRTRHVINKSKSKKTLFKVGQYKTL